MLMLFTPERSKAFSGAHQCVAVSSDLDELDGVSYVIAPQCMTASPATHLALASIPGLTVLDQGRLLVISCEAELAAHYTAHVPVPGQFSLLQPYQAVAAGSSPNDALPGAAQIVSRPAADASGAEAMLSHADAHAAATADAEAELDASRTARSAEQPISRRKRNRKASKALNEAETEVRLAASQLALPGSKIPCCRGLALRRCATLRCAVHRPLSDMPHSGRHSWLHRPPCSGGSRQTARQRRHVRSRPPCIHGAVCCQLIDRQMGLFREGRKQWAVSQAARCRVSQGAPAPVRQPRPVATATGTSQNLISQLSAT